MTAHQVVSLKQLEDLVQEFLAEKASGVLTLAPGQRLVCHLSLKEDYKPIITVIAKSNVKRDSKQERHRAKRLEFTEEIWEQILKLHWSPRMKRILKIIREHGPGELQASTIEESDATDSAFFNKKCGDAGLPWRIYLRKNPKNRFWAAGFIETYSIEDDK